MKSYIKFLTMILVSAALMFCLMYLNTYRFDDVFFSVTRLYMTLIMASSMSIVMLLFMWGMYKNQKLNQIILGISALVFVCSLIMVRTQFMIADVAWMKAMIPHHSIAILTSSRANIRDPKVKELSERIIAAQKSEIIEMKELIEELSKK